MLAASAAIAWTLLYVNEIQQFGSELIGGSLFTANFVLWQSGGYFTLEMKPLLHLWSLAVEEQFYFIWPPIVIAASRYRWNRIRITAALLVASFAASFVTLALAGSDAAFYLPVSRLWEILAGALLVEVVRRHGTSADVLAPQHRDLFSVIGAVLLLAAFAMAHRFQWWPGFGALLPVAGTVLLIAAGQHAIVNRAVLSRRLLVAVGLISYPLYLWHWPLLTYYRVINEGSSPVKGRVIALAVAFILSAFTYRFVELPIRFGKHRQRSALLLLIPLAMIAAVGIAYRYGQVRGRLEPPFEKMQRNPPWPETDYVQLGRIRVTRYAGSGTSTVLFIGDSHAAMYGKRVRYLGDSLKRSLPTAYFVTYGGCAPFRYASWKGNAGDGFPFPCEEVFKTAQRYAADRSVKTILISAFWEHYKRPGGNADAGVIDVRHPGVPFAPDAAFRDLATQIREWVNAGKKVYVINSNPTRTDPPWSAKYPPRLFGITHHNHSVRTRKEVDDAVRPSSELVVNELGRAGAIIINPIDYLCSNEFCPDTLSDGTRIYRDKDHLGSAFIAHHASFIDQVFGVQHH